MISKEYDSIYKFEYGIRARVFDHVSWWIMDLKVRLYRILIRNQTQREESVLVLTPAPDLELHTLKCPCHTAANDVISIHLQCDEQDVKELARFMVPGIFELEDNNKTFVVKKVMRDGFELVIEYRRNRIDSRNKRDLDWELLHGFIHIRDMPYLLKSLLDYLREEHSYVSLLEEKDVLNKAIEIDMKDERRLQLALLDIKASLSAKRKQLVVVDKAMIPGMERYNMIFSVLESALNSRQEPEKIDSV